jgi:hypothetical protein
LATFRRVSTKKIIIDRLSIKKQHEDSNKNASDEPGAIHSLASLVESQLIEQYFPGLGGIYRILKGEG